MNQPEKLILPTRDIDPALVATLRSLSVGQKIQITQTVCVGAKKWTTTTTGSFRGVNYLATGVVTERVPEDDIVVPMVHFTKENGEMSSVAIDEHTKISTV